MNPRFPLAAKLLIWFTLNLVLLIVINKIVHVLILVILFKLLVRILNLRRHLGLIRIIILRAVIILYNFLRYISIRLLYDPS